jgi:hypothetical protein
MRALPASVGLPICASILLAAGGCGVVQSNSAYRLEAAEARPEGVFYSLPKGVVTFTLTASPSQAIFEVTGSPVRYIPDNQHQYFLNYIRNPASDDIVDVQVSSPNGFLKRIDAKVTDQSAAIILAVAKTISGLRGGLQGGVLSGAGPLDQITVDPANWKHRSYLCLRFGTKLLAFASNMKGICGDDAFRKGQREACWEYDRIVSTYSSKVSQLPALCDRHAQYPTDELAAQSVPVSFTVDEPEPIDVGVAADCTIGACYRPARPYTLRLSIAGGASASTPIELPNGSPLIAIDVSRALMVQKKTIIVFNEKTGLLESVEVEKPSEALAVAKLPIEVAKVILSAPTSILQLQVTNINTEATLTQKLTDLAHAEGVASGTAAKLQAAGGVTPAEEDNTPILSVRSFNGGLVAAPATKSSKTPAQANAPGQVTTPATDATGPTPPPPPPGS